MQISIITPNLNYGHYLEDAIQSVLSQDVQAQLIITDGKSTDQSFQILDKYSALTKNVVWSRYQDLGQSDALNNCLNLADGEWIGWLNSDEFYEKSTFLNLVKNIEKYPEVDIFFGDTIFVDENGKAIRKVGKHGVYKSMLTDYGTFVQTCSFFVRKSVLDTLPRPVFRTDLDYVMDGDLFLKLKLRGFIFKHTPSLVGFFRIHNLQKTGTKLTNGQREERAKLDLEYETSEKIKFPKLTHRLLKVLNAGYVREFAFFLRHRGKSMIWWT